MDHPWTILKKTASAAKQEQEEELRPRADKRSWPGRSWMPCRIPIQDALVAMMPPAAGQRKAEDEDFPPVHERRYLPLENGT